ncbi:MAG: hypothetical protein MK108_00225 [Mariniblastus sp.]|nr:hypothetical protein [Mariniblastus sp.]
MKRTLFTLLLLGVWLLANGFVAGQSTDPLPTPGQLVQWLDSPDFHKRQTATAGLIAQQSKAVEPVLGQYLDHPDNLEIRTRCYRILMRLIESEPFANVEPPDRYGLSRRLLALDPRRFPELENQLFKLQSLSVNPTALTPDADVTSALQTAGIRVEESGNRTVVYLEDSWDRPPDQLQSVRSISGPVTFVFGFCYKYEYLKQLLGANVQEFRFHSNQHSPAGRAGIGTYPTFDQRDTQLLSRFGQLRSLDIAYVRVDPDALRHLAALRQLERLSLGGSFQDGNLKFLPQLKDLVHLDIRAAKQTEGVFLEHVARLKKLTSLNIETARVGDEHLPALAQLPNLKTLYAPRTLGDEGAKHVAKIDSLEVLVLPESDVTKKGLASLSQLENLYHLTINMKRLDEEALPAIAAMKGLTSLRMTNSQLSGENLVTLGRLQKLKFLYVESKQITASGLLSLSEHFPSLETLEIRKHNLMDQDFKRFGALRPEINLLHPP